MTKPIPSIGAMSQRLDKDLVYRVPRSSIPVQSERRVRLHMSVLLALVFITALISPFVSYIGHGLILAWIVFPFWVIVALAECRSLGRRILPELSARRFELWAFVAWFLVIMANTVLGRGYAGIMHLEIMGTIGMLLFMDLIYTARDDGSREFFMTLMILWVGVESAWAIPTLWYEPLLPRFVMSGVIDAESYARAMKAGVGEYGLYTGLSMGFPFMMGVALERRGWTKMVLLLACVPIGLAVLLSTFLGAILLLLGGVALFIVFYFWNANKMSRPLFVGIVVIVMLFYVWSTFLGTSEQGQMMLDKLETQMSSVLERGIVKGDVTGRGELWLNSIDTFKENPLVGVGPTFGVMNPNLGYVVGGHSSWLDIPAEYGMIGMAVYLSFILGVMRRTLIAERGKRDLLALSRIAVCLLFLLGGAYNPVVFIPQVNVILLLLVLGGVRGLPSSKSPRAQTMN